MSSSEALDCATANVKMAVVSFDIESGTTAAIKAG